jgi:hypothetical protein
MLYDWTYSFRDHQLTRLQSGTTWAFVALVPFMVLVSSDSVRECSPEQMLTGCTVRYRFIVSWKRNHSQKI